VAYPSSVQEIINEKEKPALWANHMGLIEGINEVFTRTYGWEKSDVIGKSITFIMPPQFRELHHIGFSRFLSTEQSKIQGKPLPLAVLFKDGKVMDAEHFILGEKRDGNWVFAATITLR